MIFDYLKHVALICLPWILSLGILGYLFNKSKAKKMLALQDAEASNLALKAVLAALAFAMPVALLVPIWSLVNLIVYYVLATGVQVTVARTMHPELASKLIWRWSWLANTCSSGIAAIVHIIAMAIMFAIG